MKAWAVVFTFSLCAPLWAMTGFPSGSYEGTGEVWTLETSPHPYRVEMEVTQDGYLETWSSPSRQGRLTIKVSFEKDSQILMTILESSHGSLRGYCGRTACHIEGIASNGSVYEQTYWFEGDTIRKVGSETVGSKKTLWESHLKRKAVAP